jgi:hypothetical protein
MHASPITLPPFAPLRQAYTTFRTLGMRHLFVLESDGSVAGIITRKSLTLAWIQRALQQQQLQAADEEDRREQFCIVSHPSAPGSGAIPAQPNGPGAQEERQLLELGSESAGHS